MALFRKDDDGKGVHSQQLTDITRGLQHAAAATMDMVADQFIRMLEEFFVPEEDGTLRAKMVRVQVSETDFVELPMISLVRPRGLTLEGMRVDLSVKLDRSRVKDVLGVNATRSSFTVSIAPKEAGAERRRRRSDVIDVSLEFKAWEAPEAAMKLIDMYTNLVTPETRASPEGERQVQAYATGPEYQALRRRYERRQREFERRLREQQEGDEEGEP